MFNRRTKLGSAVAATTVAAALVGLGAGTSNATVESTQPGWPTPKDGGYLFSGIQATGTATQVDLNDLGTCHTLSTPAQSYQIVSDSAELELFGGTDCASGGVRRTRSAVPSWNIPYASLSYRVVPPMNWPEWKEGAYLYSGTGGTGTETEADLNDVGTCHTLSEPILSFQVVSGSGALELYSGADCTTVMPFTVWRTGTLAKNHVPWVMRSYRAVTP